MWSVDLTCLREESNKSSPCITGPTGRLDVGPGRSPGKRIKSDTQPQRGGPNDRGRAALPGLWRWWVCNPQAVPGADIGPTLRAAIPVGRVQRGSACGWSRDELPRCTRPTELRIASARAISDGSLYCSTGRRNCGGLFVMQGGSPFHVFEAQTPVRRWGAVDVGTGDAVERVAGAASHAPNRIPRPPHRELTDGSGPGLSSSLQKRVAHFF